MCPDRQAPAHLEDYHLRPIQRLRMIRLKNVLFTLRTLRFSLWFGTLWVLLSCAYDLQTPTPLNKSVLFISSQNLLTLCVSW